MTFARCGLLAAFAFLFIIQASVLRAADRLPDDRAHILKSMARAADWQLDHLDEARTIYPRAADKRDWRQATFWVGLTRLAQLHPDPRYRDRIMALGADEQWRLGRRLSDANDHLIGQVWIWAAANGAGPDVLKSTREGMDRLVAARAGKTQTKPAPDVAKFPKCDISLCWCDALFMSPPTLAMLSQATGDPKYAGLAFAETDEAIALLYDRRQKLFDRDDRFIGRRDEQGRRLFWSRGNGWVLAGLATMLSAMKPDDRRTRSYTKLFRTMAHRVKDLQRPDGYWSPSMLDPDGPPEASGTALFVYALAWGVNARVLDRNRFAPAIARGWSALDRAVRPDGGLGWVQPVDEDPGPVRAEDSEPYGTGAYLLAGAQMIDMVESSPRSQR